MRFVLTLLATLVFAAPLSAADIKVIGSPGLRQPYTELVPGFEKATAHKVTTTWGGVNEVANKVAAGEIADIVLLPVKQIDDLIRQGKLDRANTATMGRRVSTTALRTQPATRQQAAQRVRARTARG